MKNAAAAAAQTQLAQLVKSVKSAKWQMRYSQIVIALMLSLSAWALSTPAAHTQENSADKPSQAERQGLTKDALLTYLASIKIVAAGVGFINAQIGDPMNSILTTWGKPQKTRKNKLTRTVKLLYQPDPNTTIIFSGKDKLQTITISGKSGEFFKTRRGVTMGMSSAEVARLYSRYQFKSTRIPFTKSQIEYPKIGINFHFDDKKLVSIVVYAPK